MDTSESLWACAPFTDPDDGRVEGGDCEFEEGDAEEEEARLMVS